MGFRQYFNGTPFRYLANMRCDRNDSHYTAMDMDRIYARFFFLFYPFCLVSSNKDGWQMIRLLYLFVAHIFSILSYPSHERVRRKIIVQPLELLHKRNSSSSLIQYSVLCLFVFFFFRCFSSSSSVKNNRPYGIWCPFACYIDNMFFSSFCAEVSIEVPWLKSFYACAAKRSGTKDKTSSQTANKGKAYFDLC